MNRDLFRALSISLAVALLAGCALRQAQNNVPPIGTNDLGDSYPYHKTFHYTGAEQSFVVPAWVTSMKVIARGAAGSDVGAYGNLSGLGGRVYAVIPVTPHERLYIFVGGAGHNYGPRGFGGYNGGGGSFCCGGLAGGGATDIREGDDKLRGRIVVAGGGGGQGAGTRGGGSGGDGGSLTGGSGGDARDYG